MALVPHAIRKWLDLTYSVHDAAPSPEGGNAEKLNTVWVISMPSDSAQVLQKCTYVQV